MPCCRRVVIVGTVEELQWKALPIPRDVERLIDVAVPLWRGLDAIRVRAVRSVERSRGLLRAGAIQWRESYLEAMLGRTTAMFLCQQSSMSYGRVEGEGCDGLLPVPRGEGRVQHEVGGAALGTRGDDGMRRVRAQPVPRGGGERGDVGGDGQHGDGDGVVRERSGCGLCVCEAR